MKSKHGWNIAVNETGINHESIRKAVFELQEINQIKYFRGTDRLWCDLVKTSRDNAKSLFVLSKDNND